MKDGKCWKVQMCFRTNTRLSSSFHRNRLLSSMCVCLGFNWFSSDFWKRAEKQNRQLKLRMKTRTNASVCLLTDELFNNQEIWDHLLNNYHSPGNHSLSLIFPAFHEHCLLTHLQLRMLYNNNSLNDTLTHTRESHRNTLHSLNLQNTKLFCVQ